MAGKQFEAELKVGLFVALGLALVLGAIIALGSTENLLTRKNRFTTHFTAVDGLIQGAKVVIGGVSVGTITEISFDGKRRDIRVDYSVTKQGSEWVREDSMAEVLTQGVLGDKYLSITPGSPDKKPMEDGAEIPYRASKDLTQFLSKGDSLMATLNSIAGSMDRLLKDFESGGKSSAFFSGMATSAKNLSAVTAKLSNEIAPSIASIVEKVDNGTGTVGALINDPGLYDDLKTLLGGANRNRIVRNLVRDAVKRSGETPAGATPASK